jgi:phage shock protein A
MAHDKIRAAARERMAKTGEPYTAARRAVVGEQHYTASPGPGVGYALRMSGEIHDWLADLRGSDQPAALRVMKALVRLMREGANLADPLVISTADSWSWALAEALDRSYHERLERLQGLRHGEAYAVVLVRDIESHVGDLEAAQARLEDVHRTARAGEAGGAGGGPPQAGQAARNLAAIQQQAAEARLLLARMIEARDRLREQNRRLQSWVEAFRTRREVLKARHVALRGSLRAREAMAVLDPAGEDDGYPDASAEVVRAEEAELAGITAQMERELGQETRPDGLMELWPGAPWHGDIRILFAAEPPGTALLIAVLEGPEAVEERYPEAVMASADLLYLVRAGQAPEAAAHAYNDPRSLLEEFYPGAADNASVE